MKLYEFVSGTVINLDHVALVEPRKAGCRIHLSNGMNITLPNTSVRDFIDDAGLT
jgi:hypothetical protein